MEVGMEFQIQQARELISARKTSHDHSNTVTFTWQASNKKYINNTKGRLVSRFGLEVSR